MRGSTFDECFRQHFARLVAIGVAMTGDREVARDLAQEAFLRLHRRWDQVGSYDDIAGWLSRVMSNLAIDQYRSRASELRATQRVATMTVTAPTDQDDGETWGSLMAGLPPRQRVIVTMYYAADLAVADIAATLDVSPNTVKSALAKARHALRSGREDVDA